MFVVGASYLSLLQAVDSHCSLLYASIVNEVTEDGTLLCGIEIEIPTIATLFSSSRIFFSAIAQHSPLAAYEEAAFQAVCHLQSIYGFVVMDYIFQGMIVYRKIAQAALALAATSCVGQEISSPILRCNVFRSNNSTGMIPMPLSQPLNSDHAV